MSEEIKQDWRKELEHVVKYRLTTDFVTDRQILTELFDHLLSQALEKRDSEWKEKMEKEFEAGASYGRNNP